MGDNKNDDSEEEDDPFAVFGDDDDEEDTAESNYDGDKDYDTTAVSKAQLLVDKANQSMMASFNNRQGELHEQQQRRRQQQQQQQKKQEEISKVRTGKLKEGHRGEDDKIDCVWSWPSAVRHSEPLYVCPDIELISTLNYGGSRGYVSKKEIKAGTLVLVEEPMLLWPTTLTISSNSNSSTTEQQQALDPIESIRYILQHDKCYELVKDMEYFHPTKEEFERVVKSLKKYDNDHNKNSNGSDDVGEQITDMIHYIEEKYVDEIFDELIDMANKCLIENSNPKDKFSKYDIIRLILCIRYNSLESGLYRYIAMLNHACIPNCIKYRPVKGKNKTIGLEGQWYSEVRATRKIQKGEPLTISYIPNFNTLQKCHSSRRQYLWDQHRFDIGCNVDNIHHHRMEVVNGVFPPSTIQCSSNTKDDKTSSSSLSEDSNVMERIESTMLELQDMYDDICAALNNIGLGKSAKTNGSASIMDQLRALEVTTEELYTQAKDQLRNEYHILLMPCLRLHTDICHSLLDNDNNLSSQQRFSLLGRLLISLTHLVTLQTFLYGTDHCDIARTYLDISNNLKELLSYSNKRKDRLKKLSLAVIIQPTTMQHDENKNIDTMKDQQKILTQFEEYSSYENSCRREYDRIKDLYPHDVEEKIL